MAIDVRANVTCSLGTLISASISDDYIQGSGLIKTQGSCEISGLIAPVQGTVVTFNYTKSGVTRTVPRKLRVLSSFADPFRRTTKVELGCKLTYLQDLSDPIKLRPSDDPENEDLGSNDAEIITFPTYASSVALTCLSALGISATSIPLTNKFSVAEFDLSSGYVNVLSDLLVSESYCGYLDLNERLNIIDLAFAGGGGPVLGSQSIIDIGAIGVGELAGDSVFVSYSTLKLKPPEDEAISCRDTTLEEEEEVADEPEYSVDTVHGSSSGQIVISYSSPSDGAQRTAVFSDRQSSYDETLYQVKSFKNQETGEEERKSVVIQRKTYEDRTAASLAGGLVSQYLSAGLGFGNFTTTTEVLEKYSYDQYGNETLRSLTKYSPLLEGLGSVGLQMIYPKQDDPNAPEDEDTSDGGAFGTNEFASDEGTFTYVTIPGGTFLSEEIITKTYTNGEYKQTTTARYGPWFQTIPGQQSIAEARDSFTSASGVASYISSALTGRFLIDFTASTERRTGGDQEAPLPEEEINAEVAEDEGDPNNGFKVESVSETEVAVGSSLATRRIELSMPYAPDDTFRRTTVSTDPLRYCYYSSKSDAETKAGRYGRAQNRILFGNRNGMNIQTTPEYLPEAPFAPFYIDMNGVVSQYRMNGTSWTMDSNGIVVSTDALYWGVVGKTA